MIGKVKCINNIGQHGNVFALTVGNIYDIRETKGEYMIILSNDNGAVCGYHRKHFEIVEEKKLLTDKQILDSISITDKSVSIRTREDKNTTLWTFNFWGTNDFGCGNKAFFKIEKLIERCQNLPEDMKDLKIEIFKKVIKVVVESFKSSTGLLLFSTYTNRGDGVIPYLSALEDGCTASAEAHNPNSSNDVCIWIFATAKPKKRKAFSFD
jgi:hypothetical protein